MNSQQKNEDQEAYLAQCPSFRDDSRDSISSALKGNEEAEDGDAEFEFSIGDGPAVSLNDDIFANGQILPVVYPVFNQRLLDSDPSVHLRTLLISDRAEIRSGSQSSSSSAESLEIAPGTYCEWSAPQSLAGRVKKSSSTASSGTGSESRRWYSVRDLVAGRRRSQSDGKHKFVFLNEGPDSVDLKDKSPIASPKREKKKKKDEEDKKKSKKVVKEMDLVTAHRLFYGKEKMGRRSFLPYRPELVPLFTNSRTQHLHPF